MCIYALENCVGSVRLCGSDFGSDFGLWCCSMSFKKVVKEQVCVSGIRDALSIHIVDWVCLLVGGSSVHLRLEERTLALLALGGFSVHPVARLNLCMPCLLSRQLPLPPYLCVLPDPIDAQHKP